MTLVWTPGYDDGSTYTPGKLVLAKEFTWNETIWNPSMISTALWLDAADTGTVTLASGAVSQWNDKSGNGRHFTQAAAANRPTLETSVQNGLQAVRFINGPGLLSTVQWLENLSFEYAGNQISLFSVHRNLSQSAPVLSKNTFGRLFSFAASGSEDFNNTQGVLLAYGVTSGIALYRNNATIATTGAINDQWCVVDAVRDAGIGSVSLNGATRVNGTTSTANQGITRARIGNDFTGVDSGVHGWIGEQIAIFGTLDTANTERMQGYLAHKWGLTASLPNDHPYKTVGPTP